VRVVQLTLFLAFSFQAGASQWFVASSAHFEVYSDGGADGAAETLLRFEQLRAVVDQNQLVGAKSIAKKRPPIRVIAFDSESEYAAYKPKPSAEAYFTAAEDRDYIVLKVQDSFGIAAHEYAHFVLHSKSLKLPPWLSEGIAEMFSTLTIAGDRCTFGGPLPARVYVLRHQKWLPFGDLFRADSGLFYAESWAITDMLFAHPAYAGRFPELIAALSVEGADSRVVIEKLYGKDPAAVVQDAKEWIGGGRSSTRSLAFSVPDTFETRSKPLSDRDSRTMVADLLLANGKYTRAQESYEALLKSSPNDPDILGALGITLLRENQRMQAAANFRKALDNHLNNASVCYRYALLEDDEEERALQCAISAEPGFEDARYKLALLENNQGKYAEAVANLRAMKTPSGPRAFAYWTAMASALTDLDRRPEAQAAADEALRCASSTEEQARARQLRYVAATDMTVRFVQDSQGNLQLTTTRVRHGGTADFNPFIEPNDIIASADGQLKEVQCKEGRLTGLLIENEKGRLSLSVPDPLHVMIRNGPSQLFCGTQPRTFVKVEYASTGTAADGGLLRGMEFLSALPVPSAAAERKQ
jgi:tetratricopeptide (TPR) repeat protein